MIKNATINPPDTNAVSKTNETAHFHENSDHVAGVAIFADGVLYEPFLKLQKKKQILQSTSHRIHSSFDLIAC